MDDDIDDYMDISGVQHFCFCRRQWALIYLEKQWEENSYTVDGHIMHEKCHDEQLIEKRGNLLICRGMMVHSNTLKIKGICDVVELQKNPDGVKIHGKDGLWKPIPIEYKKGKPKTHNADKLQLCAQAICIEEMLCCNIDFGYIYYGEIKRREKVMLDPNLRLELINLVSEMYGLYEKHTTPKVREFYGCKECSLNNLCLPEICKKSALKYINSFLKDEVI